MQEIFNKVEQNQLERTKNVGKFLSTYAVTTLSISAGSTYYRAEMSCGTQPTDKWGWLGGKEEVGGGVGQWLKILVILRSRARLRQPRSQLPEIMSSEYPAGTNAVFPFTFKKDNETEKRLIVRFRFSAFRGSIFLNFLHLHVCMYVILRGSQWGGSFYGYRLKFWLFYDYRLIFSSYG